MLKNIFLLILIMGSNVSLLYSQQIIINSPIANNSYDLNQPLPINFSVKDTTFKNKEVDIIIKFNYNYNDYSTWKEILNQKITLDTIARYVNETNINLSSFGSIRNNNRNVFPDSGSTTCIIKVEISYKVGNISNNIFDSSKIFAVAKNLDNYITENVNKNSAIRNLAAYYCEEENIKSEKNAKLKYINKIYGIDDPNRDIKIAELNANYKDRTLANRKNHLDKYYRDDYYAKNDEWRNFFPVKDNVQAQLFFEDTLNKATLQYVQNSSLNLNFDGNASLSSDIVSKYIGPFRVSVNNLVSNSITTIDTTKADSINRQDDAIQRLVGSGANLSLFVIYPWLVIQSDPEVPKKSLFRMKGLSYVKIGYDIPTVGTASKDALNFSYQIGLNLDGNLGVPELALISNLRYSFIGGSVKFRDYLKIGNENYNNVINLFKFDVGVNVDNKVRAGVSFYFGSKYVKDNFNPTAFLSIIP